MAAVVWKEAEGDLRVPLDLLEIGSADVGDGAADNQTGALGNAALHTRSRSNNEEKAIPIGERSTVTCIECGIEVDEKRLKHHLETDCMNLIVECDNIGCSTTMRLEDRSWHLENECSCVKHRNKLARHYKTMQNILVECDLCKQEINKMKLRAHKEYSCSMRVVTCDLCGDKLARSSLQKHKYTTCKIHLQREKILRQNHRAHNTFVTCNWCVQQITKKNRSHHMRNECPNRMVTCDLCQNESIKFVDLTNHQQHECPIVLHRQKLLEKSKNRVLKPCPLQCKQFFQTRSLILHCRNDCPNRFITCQASGCGASIQFRDLKKHNEQDIHYHIHIARRCRRGTRTQALADKFYAREHLSPCPLECGQAVLNKDMKKHTRELCPHRVIPCRFTHHCKQEIRFCDRTEHELNDCPAYQQREEMVQASKARPPKPFPYS